MSQPTPFTKRIAIRKTPKERATVSEPEEPPLFIRLRRVARVSRETILQVALVLALVFTGSLLLANALNDPDPVAAFYVTLTARPTLPPTVTDTPTMTPSPVTPTRTPFPTASPTAFISVKAQMLTQMYPYGWYDKMENETQYNRDLCFTYTQELCDYGMSAVNMGLYTGPGLDPSPQRFVVFVRSQGDARWWFELSEGKGETVSIASKMPFASTEIERGVCVPVIWNIISDPRLDRLAGRVGYEIIRSLLGEAGVSGLPEKVSGIPTALQFEIFDKPPAGCTVVIPNGFPSKHLPEYLRTVQ